MVTKDYFIETGVKEEYYTLWVQTIVDLRKVDENGNPVKEPSINKLGIRDFFIYYRFVQNLSKTREGAIQKAKELGLDIPESRFSLELRHLGKPSVEAFGQRLQYKKDKWYGIATKEFFEAWKSHKEELKNMGWSCWKYENPRTKESKWYMCIKPNEKLL